MNPIAALPANIIDNLAAIRCSRLSGHSHG